MLTQDRLRKLLNYDPETGIFTRLIGQGGRAAGTTAGTPNKAGYIQISVDGKTTGEWPIDETDHRHRDRADNRWAKIREATKSQNMQNMVRTPKVNPLPGAYFHKHSGLWRSEIMCDGKRRSLGYFTTPEAAHKAYRAASLAQFGEFSRFA